MLCVLKCGERVTSKIVSLAQAHNVYRRWETGKIVACPIPTAEQTRAEICVVEAISINEWEEFVNLWATFRCYNMFRVTWECSVRLQSPKAFLPISHSLLLLSSSHPFRSDRVGLALADIASKIVCRILMQNSKFDAITLLSSGTYACMHVYDFLILDKTPMRRRVQLMRHIVYFATSNAFAHRYGTHTHIQNIRKPTKHIHYEQQTHCAVLLQIN